MHEAAKGGMMEVQMAQLGVQNASDSKVKQFAQKLVTDHTKANKELESLMQMKGGSPHGDATHSGHATESSSSTQSPGTSQSSNSTKSSGATHSSGAMQSSDATHSAHLAGLQSKTGSDFDKAFVEMMVEHHEKDVSLFEKASNSATDPQVKKFATKTLPALRAHLKTAKSLANNNNNNSGRN